METFVPLISGTQAGPLGIAHLPRLWLKMRAFDAGVLAEGYRHGNGGNDEMITTEFGIDPETLAGYIRDVKPDYQSFERWFSAIGKGLEPEHIAGFTAMVRSFEMPDPRRSEWTLRFGLEPGTYTLAVGLNQLDDWDGIHERVTAPGAPSSPVIPAIGSGVAGPLGVLHFPRMWLKHLLTACGRLAEGYRLCRGFDRRVATELGFDCETFGAYVAAERPGYLAAERWVREHATTLTPETIAALNAHILDTNLPDALARETRAKLGLDESFVRSIPMNDLDDWFALHEQLKARAHA